MRCLNTAHTYRLHICLYSLLLKNEHKMYSGVIPWTHSVYINSRHEVGKKEMVRKVTVNPMTVQPIQRRDALEEAELSIATVAFPQSLSAHIVWEGKHLAGLSVILVFKDRWFLHKIAPTQTPTASIVLQQKKTVISSNTGGKTGPGRWTDFQYGAFLKGFQG